MVVARCTKKRRYGIDTARNSISKPASGLLFPQATIVTRHNITHPGLSFEACWHVLCCNLVPQSRFFLLFCVRCSFSPPNSCEAINEGAIVWTNHELQEHACIHLANKEITSKTYKLGGKRKGNSSRTLSSDMTRFPVNLADLISSNLWQICIRPCRTSLMSYATYSLLHLYGCKPARPWAQPRLYGFKPARPWMGPAQA
jgi:hypothetical protein